MRPYYILLLTLALIFAISNAAVAAPATNSLTVADNEESTKRSLRSTAADDEEERFLGLGKVTSKVTEKLRLMKMRRAASKEMKAKAAEAAKAAKVAKAAEKAKAAEAAKAAKAAKAAEKAKAAEAAKAAKAAEKAAKAQSAAAKKAAIQKEKENRLVNGWLDEMRDPNKVHKDLGLTKLGDKAKDSPLNALYQRYEEAYRLKMRARVNGVNV
ncbi:hypothetical protein PHYBOEH_005640 [Phytophthora boehmeriae]|uniref:RxLR effector protein n=1 Tax=Phytophthora boehmeriae TaxID=109152 RepID=A0A8T1WJQ3_9STRA|nr:hypothetical protein PHYBOEH_005640 [Phytophthora boehmeriae]